jgi:hypothetical protein
MRDGAILKTDPEDIKGYVAVPFSTWLKRLPYA